MRDTDVPVETRSEFDRKPRDLVAGRRSGYPGAYPAQPARPRILLHVGVYDGKVEIVLPPGASAPEGLGFAATQISWVADRLSRIGDAVPLPTARSFLY